MEAVAARELALAAFTRLWEGPRARWSKEQAHAWLRETMGVDSVEDLSSQGCLELRQKLAKLPSRPCTGGQEILASVDKAAADHEALKASNPVFVAQGAQGVQTALDACVWALAATTPDACDHGCVRALRALGVQVGSAVTRPVPFGSAANGRLVELGAKTCVAEAVGLLAPHWSLDALGADALFAQPDVLTAVTLINAARAVLRDSNEVQ